MKLSLNLPNTLSLIADAIGPKRPAVRALGLVLPRPRVVDSTLAPARMVRIACKQNPLSPLIVRIGNFGLDPSTPDGMPQNMSVVGSIELLLSSIRVNSWDCTLKLRCGHIVMGATRPLAIRTLQLPEPRRVAPPIRGVKLWNGNASIRAGEEWIVRIPNVEEGTGKFFGFPQVRRDASGEVADMQRLQFVQQAAIQQGIDSRNVELVGIFKRVPIEIVGRTRFNEKRGVLIFTVQPRLNVRQTRVHDVAMIRDGATSRLHMVSDMTRVSIARLG